MTRGILVRSAGAALVLAASACGGGGGPDAGATSGDVVGTWRTTYWLENGSSVVVNETPGPGDAVAAIAGSGASATRVPGTLELDGTFVVTGVPPGPYLLEFQLQGGIPTFADLTSRMADLDRDLPGRPDAAFATTITQVTFDVSGVSTWRSGDALLFVAPNAGGGAILAHPSAPDGATSFSFTRDWRALAGIVSNRIALLDAAKGDGLWVSQLELFDVTALGTTTTFWIQKASRHAHLTNLTIADGDAQTVSLPMAAAAQTGSIPIDFRASQFAAFDAEVSPSATGHAQEVSVGAFPGALSYPTPVVSSYPAYQVRALLGGGARDVNLGSVSYGRFPGWSEYRVASRSTTGPVTAPGATSSTVIGGTVTRTDALPAPNPIVPVVSPPRWPRLDGHDAHVERTGVGTTPTLSWSAPARGSPDRYTVTVLHVFLTQTGGTATESIANFRTQSRSVTIPSGLLAAGERYVAIISAVAGSPVPYESLRARGITTGYGYAQTLTAPFEP